MLFLVGGWWTSEVAVLLKLKQSKKKKGSIL